MTAQTLRDAAKVLRERAENATAGPWRHETYGNGQAPLVIGSDMAVAETFDKPHLSDAAYIATMHPGVAVALANWLDLHARNLDGGLMIESGQSPALTVARAVLCGDA